MAHPFPLSGTVLVGRGTGAEVQLNYPAVSTGHCSISATEIIDHGSRNGTSVDGRVAPPGVEVVFPVGGIVCIGATRLMLRPAQDDQSVAVTSALGASGGTVPFNRPPCQLPDVDLPGLEENARVTARRTVMLLRFEVSNHRSIMEPVELSMIAVDEDRPAARSFELLNERALTVAGIYGPNASGTSNLLDALDWLSNAVGVSLRGRDEEVPRDPTGSSRDLVQHRPSKSTSWLTRCAISIGWSLTPRCATRVRTVIPSEGGGCCSSAKDRRSVFGRVMGPEAGSENCSHQPRSLYRRRCGSKTRVRDASLVP